jgi:hypothetical protein
MVLPEYCSVDELDSAAQGIAQGDVVEWLQPEPPWRALGIIVTASCDIVLKKHGGTISYVPVLTLEEYLREHLLP